ncbi:hypothetical protein ACFWDN_21300 [Micromonospora chalcea]
MSPAARAFAAMGRAVAALVDSLNAVAAQLGDARAQRWAARRQGQVLCDFPHETLSPDYPGGPYGVCPLCGAAL